jgi:thiamine kinase-like enzyme
VLWATPGSSPQSGAKRGGGHRVGILSFRIITRSVDRIPSCGGLSLAGNENPLLPDEQESMLIAPDRGQRGSGSKLKVDWKRALGVQRLAFQRLRSRPERAVIERLRKLGVVRGPFSIERISGGLSNHNFAVRTGGESYFVRICQELPLLGIDRRNEIVCHQAASQQQLAPELIYHERGLLITRFVEGRTLDPLAIREPAMLPRVAVLLGQLHDGWDVVTGEVLYFCAFQTVRTYARTAARLKASLPHEIDRILEDITALSRRIAPFRPVLCHNDMLPANLIDDGRRLWLLDWEYSGAGHPLFDLAHTSTAAGLSLEQQRVLLEAYPGCLPTAALAELQIFRVVALLRESLWSTIQTVASDIEFDYQGYARVHLEAYRAARAALE